MTDLQFEKAEFEKPPEAATCGFCGQGVHGIYYQVGDKVACERCRADVEMALKQGSGTGRFFRAALYGTGAGAVGAGLWYGIRAVTDYEIGFIAILVGFMVGAAVRKGSNARGGWLYQALAVFLTYASIVSTYVPFILKGLLDQAKTADSAPGTSGPAASPVAAPDAATPAAAVAGPAASPNSAAPAAVPPSGEKPSAGQAVVGLLVLAALVFAIAFAAPFLAGFENIIGIFIIAIGLYEAWKINKHAPLEITGPFRVGAPPAPEAGG